jgi:hypothetical protein
MLDFRPGTVFAVGLVAAVMYWIVDLRPESLFTICLMAVVFYWVWHTTFRSEWLENRAQSQDLRAAAPKLGFTPDRGQNRLKDDPTFPWEYTERKVLDLMRGTSALGTTYLFNVRYGVGSDPPETVTKTLAAFHVPDRALPFFRLRWLNPPDFMEKLTDTTTALVDAVDTSLFGGLLRKSGLTDSPSTIEVVSPRNPLRRYRIVAPNEDAVRALFDPSMLERWDALAATENWAADGCGAWIVIFRSGEVIRGDAFGDFLREAESIAVAIAERAPRSSTEPSSTTAPPPSGR